MNKEKFMQVAIKEAIKAEKIGEVPIGCVIVLNNKIIAKAHNKRERKQMSTAHAEILAIQKACKKLKSWRLCDCAIYVTLEPCLMCAGAIINSRIKYLCYGAFDDKNEKFRNIYSENNLNHVVEVFSGIMKDDCSKLISSFFKKVR